MPKPKTFLLPHGGVVTNPNSKRTEDRDSRWQPVPA